MRFKRKLLESLKLKSVKNLFSNLRIYKAVFLTVNADNGASNRLRIKFESQLKKPGMSMRGIPFFPGNIF